MNKGLCLDSINYSNLYSSLFHSLSFKLKKYLKDNEDMVVLKSDKGNTTVLMERTEYEQKMQTILSDTECFTQLRRDPTQTIQREANKLITELERQEIFTAEKCKQMRTYDTECPRIYGNPKIHKEGAPLRPIISGIQGPTNNIAKIIKDILTRAYNTDNEYYVRDSFHFAQMMNDKRIPRGHWVVSLDVVNLFGNMTKTIILKTIEEQWTNIEPHSLGINVDLFKKLIIFVLDNNVCVYQEVYYRQIKGCAMGSTLSPILAQFVMDYIIDSNLTKLKHKPGFVKRFVDDIVLTYPNENLDELLEVFNDKNIDPDIEFTLEKENEQQWVPFLDTKVMRTDEQKIVLDWYRKSSASDRYLHYLSGHPLHIKVNFVLQMKSRILHIYHQKFRDKNYNELVNIMLLNGYPKNLVNNLIYSTPHRTDNSQESRERVNSEQTNNIHYCSVTNIKNLTEKIMMEFKDENLKIARRNTHSTAKLFSRMKDRIPTLQQSNVIYRIPCQDCEKNYIGQTSQTLRGRINGHRSDAKNHPERCALARHVNDSDHRMSYESVEILARAENKKKRLFLEMYHISKQQHTMNKKTDTSGLSMIYTYLMTDEWRKQEPPYMGPLDE